MTHDFIVSVCMITYNHEPFIAQAIKGVLMQSTNFKIELVIGEDFSKDNTKNICIEYASKFPERIRLLKRSKNLGMIENFIDTLNNCDGKYVAICEGDDYWTDKLKLQKQVDFLESNPNFTICHHLVNYLDDDGNIIPKMGDRIESISSFEDLALWNYIQTASCIFRNGLIKEFPEWIKDIQIGDYILHLLNANYGKIKLLKEVMAVYRIHNQGVWSSETDENNSIKTISVLEKCRSHFYPKGDKEFQRHLFRCYEHLCFSSFEKKDYAGFINYYSKILNFTNYMSIRGFTALTIRRLLCFTPKIIPLFQHLRRSN